MKCIKPILLSATLLLGGLASPSLVMADDKPSIVEQGKDIAFKRAKGNCLACHLIIGGESPGNIGPPLVGMKLRFPDKAVLRAQIEDATVKNPYSMMPPFGKHGILSAAEIDKLIEFLYTL
ncbi:sulfur oxidation c-type cytochrome SoxX [Candidatus Venteria ishoeyi]|uniref:sulfur oxidation c-type cytochrome SoxX n=1 Tax=Candidatus Venteria ishoeyi TaxID=1899563 RepID=UPI0025A6195A|nr:sulfur oxidation c-type cytochrome SoxX [Candidatus Venteria ishoeyi]MDM8546450.1 sulfur oxidation c-type cytochrome SoxX [Candidatus Venteria ishoeyi]